MISLRWVRLQRPSRIRAPYQLFREVSLVIGSLRLLKCFVTLG